MLAARKTNLIPGQVVFAKTRTAHILANARKDHSRSMPHPMIPAQWPEKRFLETRHKQGTVARE